MKKVIYSILLSFLFSSGLTYSVTRCDFYTKCVCRPGYTKIYVNRGDGFVGPTCEYYACAKINCAVSRNGLVKCSARDASMSMPSLSSDAPAFCRPQGPTYGGLPPEDTPTPK